MSYLDKLLAGRPVTWKPLGEVGKIYSGLSGKTKDDFKEGNAQFIPYTNIFNNLSVDTDDLSVVRISDSEKQNVVKYGDVLFTGSSETADEVGMSSVVTSAIERPLFLNSFCFGYRFNSDIYIIPGYCKHLFRGSFMRKAIIRAANGVTRHNISKTQFLMIPIPIPPRDVQEEIVRVLDRFTELEAELETELEAELEARQKQYAYYRDLLLSFPDDAVTYLPLGDVVDIRRGKRVVRKDLAEEGSYAVFQNSLTPLGYFDKWNVPKDSCFVVAAGAAGEIGYSRENFWAADDIYYFESSGNLIDRYLYHFLLSSKHMITSKVRNVDSRTKCNREEELGEKFER